MQKIGIIGAMPEEIELFLKEIKEYKIVERSRMKIYEGVYHGQNVAIVCCGIGKVNAAICAQNLINSFGVTHIINSGIAGAIREHMKIGDMVISTDSMHHDFDTSPFGDDYGVISNMETSIFKADERLIEIAKKACEELNEEFNTVVGRVVSGDQFIADKEKKKWITKQFDATCVEMEGAAIGQVSWVNNIPYVIIRVISDGTDDLDVMEYYDFKLLAIKRLHAIVDRMISKL